MSLDLTRVASQAEGMISRLKTKGAERKKHLDLALATLHEKSGDIAVLQRKIASSKTTWLVAGLVDGLDFHCGPADLPADFTVIATDGSHIDVDRHHSMRCFLINIGSVLLRYGRDPDAVLESTPYLYADEADLVIIPDNGKGREQIIEGQLLGIKRSVDECKELARLSAEQPQNSTTLALLDGSLILWGLEAYPEFVTEKLLDKGLLTCLNEMKKLTKSRNIALASYISFPRSSDVLNALRVAICPREHPDCDRYCPPGSKKDCDVIAGIQDRELFNDILCQGERSALFSNQSKVVREHYGEHCVYFFYLKLDDEIARVEIPEWVARNENLLNLTHTLVLDQCRRGQGYPVALSEAHEQAVVTTADREYFWQMVESLMTGEHLPAFTSGKSFSKKTRWV